MATGSSFYRSLQSQQEQLSSQMRQSEQEVSSANQGIESCNATIKQSKQVLIKVHLDGLRSGAVKAGNATDREAVALLEKQVAAVAQSESEIVRVREQKSTALDALSKSVGILDAAQDALARGEEQHKKELETDPVWLGMRNEWANVSGIATKAEDLQKNADAKMQEKAAVYENDRMFMYLYKRVTANKDISSMMDRWVGRQIRFEEARVNYEYVKAIPERVKERAVAARAAADVVLTKKTAYENSYKSSVDLGGLRSALELAKSDRDAKKKVVKNLEASLERLQEQQQKARSGDDPNTSAAYSALFGQVESMSDRELQAWAAQTSSNEDDRALEQLVSARQKRKGFESKLASSRQAYSDVKAQKLRMDELMSEFRRRDFGDSYSRIQLDGDDFARWYVLNQISMSDAIRQIDNNQRFDTPPPPPPPPAPPPYSYGGYSGGSSGGSGWSSSDNDSPSPSPSPSSSDWSSSSDDTF